jgi:hypothetical protein
VLFLSPAQPPQQVVAGMQIRAENAPGCAAPAVNDSVGLPLLTTGLSGMMLIHMCGLPCARAVLMPVHASPCNTSVGPLQKETSTNSYNTNTSLNQDPFPKLHPRKLCVSIITA